MLELLGVIIAVEAALKRGRAMMSNWAMSQDMAMVLESLVGFQVGDESGDSTETVLPNGAPKKWDAWIARARVALSESAARRTARWAALEAGDELEVDDEYEVFDSEDFDEFDFDGGMDIDDSRWESKDYPLDPYWSTCPAIIEDQGVQASANRWQWQDGQQPLTRENTDRLAGQRKLAVEWAAERAFLAGLYQSGSRAASLVAAGRHAAQMATGYESLADITSQSVLKDIGWGKDDESKLVRSTSAEERSYMQHGACVRDARFLRLIKLLQDGEAYLKAGHSVGAGFLAWLSKCWSHDVESRVASTSKQRKDRSDGGNKTLACGRDYFLTAGQTRHLRDRRRTLLRRFGSVEGLTYTKGKRFIAAYSRKHWETSANKQGESIGARRAMDFGPNPVKSAGPSESWALTESAREHVAQLRKHRELVRNRKLAYVNGQMMVLG